MCMDMKGTCIIVAMEGGGIPVVVVQLALTVVVMVWVGVAVDNTLCL